MAGPINGQRLQPTIALYVSSPSNRAYCYAELAVSSLAVAKTIASTHCTYTTEGWLSLSRPGWLS